MNKRCLPARVRPLNTKRLEEELGEEDLMMCIFNIYVFQGGGLLKGFDYLLLMTLIVLASSQRRSIQTTLSRFCLLWAHT